MYDPGVCTLKSNEVIHYFLSTLGIERIRDFARPVRFVIKTRVTNVAIFTKLYPSFFSETILRC